MSDDFSLKWVIPCPVVLFSVFSNILQQLYNKQMFFHLAFSTGIQTHRLWDMSLLSLTLDQ